jgi:hypothetical protein
LVVCCAASEELKLSFDSAATDNDVPNVGDGRPYNAKGADYDHSGEDYDYDEHYRGNASALSSVIIIGTSLTGFLAIIAGLLHLKTSAGDEGL